MAKLTNQACLKIQIDCHKGTNNPFSHGYNSRCCLFARSVQSNKFKSDTSDQIIWLTSINESEFIW